MMSARLLRTWAKSERQRRSCNRFFGACLILLLAVMAGYAWSAM